MVVDYPSPAAADTRTRIEHTAQLALVADSDALLAMCSLIGNSGRVVEIAVDRHAISGLLEYLQGKGRRDVSIETQGIRLHGRLFTSWDGTRHWFVQLI